MQRLHSLDSPSEMLRVSARDLGEGINFPLRFFRHSPQPFPFSGESDLGGSEATIHGVQFFADVSQQFADVPQYHHHKRLDKREDDTCGVKDIS